MSNLLTIVIFAALTVQNS